MAHFLRVVRAHNLTKKYAEYEGIKLVSVPLDRCERSQDARSSDEHGGKSLEDNDRRSRSIPKSFLGFLSGILLTCVFFFLLYVGVSFSLKRVTYFCVASGILLSLGLAFSRKLRCYVLLLLPVFFSKQGRQAILAYALFLAFTGPAKNTMQNMRTLSDSMNCGQEMVRGSLTQIIQLVHTPFKFAKETFDGMDKALKESTGHVYSFVGKTKRIVFGILDSIYDGANWLEDVIKRCNKKFGTPFQRCMKAFDEAITNCKAKLGLMDFMCHIVHVVKCLCYTAKGLDFMCSCHDFHTYGILKAVEQYLFVFCQDLVELFYVSVDFCCPRESTETNVKRTKSVSKTILQKISAKIEKLQNVFNVFGFMFGFLFLLVVFKVYDYKYKYLTSDSYDNIYLSKYTMQLDKERCENGRETIMPLEEREIHKYGLPTTLRVLDAERSRITQSMFLLTLTSFKVISFLVCDYSLYWILLTIYEAGRGVFDGVGRSKIALHVEGTGFLAEFYRHLGRTFDVPQNPSIRSRLHCLPDPTTPDTGRYLQIGFLLSLCWLLTVTEPYGLRLRNLVMSHYYPDRARERAVWLYNHILRSRSSFLRFSRRQLRSKYNIVRCQSVGTYRRRRFGSIFVSQSCIRGSDNSCILCGVKHTAKGLLRTCRTPDCPGTYCNSCFDSLNNSCAMSQHPIDYDEDVTDLSEEIDSSEDDRCWEMTDVSSRMVRSNGDLPFLTFKELELRDKSCNVPPSCEIDCARLSDLTGNERYLKEKLKDALRKRIRKLKKDKKMRERRKVKGEYGRIKVHLNQIVCCLKKKKKKKTTTTTTTTTTKKILKSNLKMADSLTTKSSLSANKSRVRICMAEEPPSASAYAALKIRLRQKIQDLKRRQCNGGVSTISSFMGDERNFRRRSQCSGASSFKF